jgi:homopolymeric O-antigen transport system ATP-binding protein
MNNIAVRVDNLCKQYRIGIGQRRHDTLRDQLTESLKSIFRSNGHGSRSGRHRSGASNIIWAVKDICFELQKGETLGIIGRNGAGKSTLLKILSRITEPTAGYAEVHGRLGSLLEVGTGFSGELTGRENVYLNGAILGMRKAEIDRKFDEIVAFAEIENFLDTPVKRYSSGMYMRLAFAVAAHLEPEILIIDEVLAVGDSNFQKKCLGKMGDVAKQGRTVLFVSHNMAAIQSLCSRAIGLEAGRIVCAGSVAEVVQNYLNSGAELKSTPLGDRMDRAGDGSARLVSITVGSADGESIIHSSSRLAVTIRYESDRQLQHPIFLVSVNDPVGSGIFLLNSEGAEGLPDILPSHGSVTCITDPINVTPGRCSINVALLKGAVIADHVVSATYFDVEADNAYGPKVPPRSWVLCLVRQRWIAGDSNCDNQ